MRYHEIIEAFDQPYKGKWEKSDYGDVDLNTKLPDGTYLNIMFNQEYDGDGNEVTQVEFHRNNSQEVTGEGDAQRIFATVLDAIQKYIKKYKPQKLSFSASKSVDMDADDNGAKFNPESRAKLYDRLVQRYSKALGYRAFRADNGDIVIYELSRIKQGVAEGESNDTAISLSKLGKFHPGTDTLAEFVPERATAQYALHPDKWESTFYSLTNKDSDKLKYYGPKKISIPPGTLVGDMAIANKFYRAKTPEEQEQYAELYKASLQPYPVDVSQYRMPELLIPKQGVAEAPLADYVPMGDFNKPGPFRGADKKLVPHPVNQLKAQRFFEKTPYNFRLFFSNIPGTGRYSEYGVMDPDTVKIIFGDAGEQIVAGHEDAITVVYVGNSGDSKVMLTPWMMAHRLGHAMQSGTRGRSNNQQHPWKAGEDHFFGQVNSMLEEYYGKSGQRGGNLKAELTPEYNALFNAIGTQRSSRSGEIRRPYEFLYEIFAQYLGTGTVTFNALPANLGYGRKAWGNPSRYLNINPEYRDEAARKQATEVLSYDMELMFNDALSNAEGKILVM